MKKLDVLLWESVPLRNTENMPLDWPVFSMEVESTVPPNPPYIRMSFQDYDSYINDTDRRSRYEQAMSLSNQSENIRRALLKAQAFGQNMVTEFGVWVTLQNFSHAQVNSIAIKLASVQQLLTSGALYTALYVLDEMQPDALVTQAVIDEQRTKLQIYLGI